MTKFVFDKNKLSFVKKKTTFLSIIVTGLKWIGISLGIAVLVYALFALLFSTERERQIAAENEFMEEQYEEMSEQIDIIEDVISGLEERDKNIYQDIFNSMPPNYANADTSTIDISSLYLDSFQDIVWTAHKTRVNIDNSIYRTDKNIGIINNYLDKKESATTSIPSIIPIKNFNIAQTGASIGLKVSPFLKNFAEHNGIDLMAPLGTDVLATADGVVTSVQKGQKGSGNFVEITHRNGYVTSYSHLNDILVTNGQSVKQGSVIGRVGSSGMSFVTHLHYAIKQNGEVVDPLNYFFADISPEEYQTMITMAMNTGQSMD